jgi:hypothetical protein
VLIVIAVASQAGDLRLTASTEGEIFDADADRLLYTDPDGYRRSIDEWHRGVNIESLRNFGAVTFTRESSDRRFVYSDGPYHHSLDVIGGALSGETSNCSSPETASCSFPTGRTRS